MIMQSETVLIRAATQPDWAAIWPILAASWRPARRTATTATSPKDGPRNCGCSIQFNAVVETNTGAVALWRSLGFEVLATVPEAFHHPTHGYVGLHIMHRYL